MASRKRVKSAARKEEIAAARVESEKTAVEPAKEECSPENEAISITAVVDAGAETEDFGKMDEALRRYAADCPEQLVFTEPRRKDSVSLCVICGLLCLVLFAQILQAAQVIRYGAEFAGETTLFLVWMVIFCALDILVIAKCVSDDRFGRRYEKYCQLLRNKKAALTEDLADYAKVSEERVISDLARAVKMRLLPQGNFGKDHAVIFLSNAGFKDYQDSQAVYDGYYDHLIKEYRKENGRPDEAEHLLAAGREFSEKLRSEEAGLKDKKFTAAIDETRNLAETVFREADIYADSTDLIVLFSEYYFPSVETLIKRYRDLDTKEPGKDEAAQAKWHLISALSSVNMAYQKMHLDFRIYKEDRDIAFLRQYAAKTETQT